MLLNFHVQKPLHFENPVMTSLLVCPEKAEEPGLIAQDEASREKIQGYWLGEKHETFVTIKANILGEKAEGKWDWESKLENHLLGSESRCIKNSMKGNF